MGAGRSEKCVGHKHQQISNASHHEMEEQLRTEREMCSGVLLECGLQSSKSTYLPKKHQIGHSQLHSLEFPGTLGELSLSLRCAVVNKLCVGMIRYTKHSDIHQIHNLHPPHLVRLVISGLGIFLWQCNCGSG